MIGSGPTTTPPWVKLMILSTPGSVVLPLRPGAPIRAQPRCRVSLSSARVSACRRYEGRRGEPVGPLVAQSAAYIKGHAVGDPYRGYYFRILTRQGKDAPGGAYNYVINGRMIAGFAMVAYPAEYGRRA